MTRVEPASLPTDPTFRDLGIADAGAVAELIGACDQTYLQWAPDDWSPPPKHEERVKWEERLAEPGRWTEGAFDGQGLLVGMVAARQATDDGEGAKPIAGLGHIGALFVHPARWRQGFGLGLLEHAEQAMAERGFERAMLRTPEWAPARHFYEAAGWTPTGAREFREDFDMWVVHYEKPLGEGP
jgi:GNAT superfamily N-acetyltransferase